MVLYLVALVSGMLVPLIANAAKYAQISREIIDSGDWLKLTIAREAYNQKPPLLFWFGAVSYSLFGVSTFAFKLPVILFSLLGIFATFRLGNLLYDKKTGKLAAFFWATSLGYLYFHNDIHADTLLATNVIIAIWQFSEYFYHKKRGGFYLGVLFTGLAMLTKGPIGLVVPALAIGINLLVHKKRKEIFQFRWIIALIILVFIISPALIGLYKQFGTEGLKFYFWTNNMGRITGSYQGVNTDPLFYFYNSIYTLAPWTIFAFAGIFMEIKTKVIQIKNKALEKEASEFITLGAILPFLAILSIAKQKNPHYIMAILPLVMLLAAKWVIPIFNELKYLKTKKTIEILNYILVLLLWAALLAFSLCFYRETNIWKWLLSFLSAALIIAFLFLSKGLNKQILILLTTSTLFIFSVNTSIIPKMMEYHSTYNVAKVFNQKADDNDKLYSYRLRFWSSFFYSKSYGSWIRSEKGLPELQGIENAWVYTDGYGIGRLKANGFEFEIIETFPHRTITGQTLKFLTSEDKSQFLQDFYLVELK